VSFLSTNSDCNDSFFDAAKRARCVVVVLSTDLLGDTNCVYCLNNVIYLTHVVFVVHDLDLDNDDHLRDVNDEVKTVLTYRRRHFIWPSVLGTSTTVPTSDIEAKSPFDETERNNRSVMCSYSAVQEIILFNTNGFKLIVIILHEEHI